jgi:hypothetical protein
VVGGVRNTRPPWTDTHETWRDKHALRGTGFIPARAGGRRLGLGSALESARSARRCGSSGSKAAARRGRRGRMCRVSRDESADSPGRSAGFPRSKCGMGKASPRPARARGRRPVRARGGGAYPPIGGRFGRENVRRIRRPGFGSRSGGDPGRGGSAALAPGGGGL